MIDVSYKKCYNCDETFYFNPNAIDHNNATNDHNIKCQIGRLIERMQKINSSQIDHEFIMVGCGESDRIIDYEYFIKIFNCRIKWLKIHDYYDFYDQMIEAQSILPDLYNKRVNELIQIEFDKYKERENTLSGYLV